MAQAASLVATGTLMQKPIPPRLVEPYLTGRRAVIAGFVYLAADTSFTDPADFYSALDLGYDGSEFRPDMTELYVLRWVASTLESYQVPYSAERGGDWAGKPPFTGTGYTSWASRPIRDSWHVRWPTEYSPRARLPRISSVTAFRVARKILRTTTARSSSCRAQAEFRSGSFSARVGG